jgi:hypothetical protein
LKSSIDAACDKYCDRLLWFFFGAMGLQTGIFARLTWWEYSWDIVEPITYFATYAVVSSSLGYFLLTRQVAFSPICPLPHMGTRCSVIELIP